MAESLPRYRAGTLSLDQLIELRLLTVCAAEVYAVESDERETLCATLLGTARNIAPRPGSDADA